MSTSLYWSIIPPEPEEYNIDWLKYAIAKKIWDCDGSISQGNIEVGTELIPYLEGIVDGGNLEMSRDAQKLITAIKRHSKVYLSIHS